MAGRIEQANVASKPRERSILRTLLALLATEHVCTPPDGAATWQAVSEEDARVLTAAEVYVCPECGQCLAQGLAPQRDAQGAR